MLQESTKRSIRLLVTNSQQRPGSIIHLFIGEIRCGGVRWRVHVEWQLRRTATTARNPGHGGWRNCLDLWTCSSSLPATSNGSHSYISIARPVMLLFVWIIAAQNRKRDRICSVFIPARSAKIGKIQPDRSTSARRLTIISIELTNSLEDHLVACWPWLTKPFYRPQKKN